MVEKSHPRIVREMPNLENTMPVAKYQSSSPEAFSLEDDNMIIHAGGANYVLSVADRHEYVGLFVLNKYFLIWFHQGNFGLEVPYQSIALHALQDEHLYLQVVPNQVVQDLLGPQPSQQDPADTESEYEATVELTIKKGDQHLLPELPISRTLTTGFGMASDAQALYSAMSLCSAQNYDFEDDDEPQAPGQSSWFTGNSGGSDVDVDIPDTWVAHHSGHADDLGETDAPIEGDGDAGMDVDIGYGPIAGTVRGHEDDDDAHERAGDTQMKRKRK